ncbi:MAG TPA: S1 RNA-binding domain-containing protein [Lacipirellulaceae bacterium]|nr:S1 RNA-binding domain-containing protein [Lacipirellulaceae bacterium]
MSVEHEATPSQSPAAPSPEVSPASAQALPDASAAADPAPPAAPVIEAAPAPIHHDAAALATGDSEAAVVPRPSDRIQIGSQRGAGENVAAPAPNPVTPGPARTDRPPSDSKKKSYPPPNIRAQLPPELEQELQAALAGGSHEELMDQSATKAATAELAPESRVSGRVVSVREGDVFVDLGGPHQGVVKVQQFGETPPEVGAQLDLMVLRFDLDQGLYELSMPAAAVDVGNWDEVKEGQIVDVTVSAMNKGGLECTVANIRGFIPMGQISTYRIENPEEFVGQRLSCVITEANRRRKNLVLSHRAFMERERKELKDKLMSELAAGQIREGVVRSLQDFGAFVDLGGADGLIHVSQMSWDRVGHPSEVLQVGQKIKVRVEKVNAETGKISLVYRDMGDNPWNSVTTKFPVGTKAKGTVSKLMQFGAFVKLSPGVEGLIHISELGHGRVMRVSDVLSEGQEVEVKVLSVDVDAQRISLSLKALLPAPEKAQPRRPEPEPERPPTPEELKQAERRREAAAQLKGGIGGPSGGEKFGLKW